MDEIWKQIEGYDFFEVSNLGGVRRREAGRIKKMTPFMNCQKWSVSICENGKQKVHFVHRLVAEAFLPNRKPYGKPRKRFVSFKDKDVDNLNMGNLEWSTRIWERGGGDPFAKTHRKKSAWEKIKVMREKGKKWSTIAKHMGTDEKTCMAIAMREM